MPRPLFPDQEEGLSRVDRAINLLGALALGVTDRLSSSMGEGAAGSLSTTAALHCIDQEPGLRVEELRVPLGLSHGAVTRIVSSLVDQGLILRERDRRDARAVRLRTSELGRRRVARNSLARSTAIRRLVERLPAVWVPRLIRLADRLLIALAEDPTFAARICRLCARGRCRGDATAPCPVVLAATTHDCPSGPPVPAQDGSRVYQERRIVDGADPTIELWLEPGGAAFRLPAGRRLEVLCRGDQHGHVELERLPEGHIALHAWRGATFTVLEGGREIFVEERALSLSMGLGATTRERVESIFGDFQHRRRMSQPRWL